jgi:ankyrin repeat protein
MSRDFRQLLRNTATGPSDRHGPDGLVRRGRSRRWQAVGVTSAVAAAVVIGVAGAQVWPTPVPPIGDQSQDPTPARQTAIPTETEDVRNNRTETIRNDQTEDGRGGLAEPQLLARGCTWPASVGMRGDGSTTALHLAVLDGDIAEAEAQLLAGADPNVIDEKQDQTPLATAVHSGCIELVELLLDANADPALFSGKSNPPLTHAVNVGDPAVVDLLLAAGADPSQWSGADRPLPALHEAVGTGRLSLLPHLLQHTSDIDVAATETDPLATGEDVGLGSALEFAAAGRSRAVTILLGAGATPTRTALYRAAQWGNSAVIDELVAAGASIDAAPSGRTFADVAAEHGHDELARYLREVSYGDEIGEKTTRLNSEIERMILAAGFKPGGGGHDIGQATETIDDGDGLVWLTLWEAADAEAHRSAQVVDVYEGQDGGGARVDLGTWPNGDHVAILYCNDLVLYLSPGDSSEQGRQRVDRLAQPFAAVMGCPTDL